VESDGSFRLAGKPKLRKAWALPFSGKKISQWKTGPSVESSPLSTLRETAKRRFGGAAATFHLTFLGISERKIPQCKNWPFGGKLTSFHAARNGKTQIWRGLQPLST